jgi:hypothetical protein
MSYQFSLPSLSPQFPHLIFLYSKNKFDKDYNPSVCVRAKFISFSASDSDYFSCHNLIFVAFVSKSFTRKDKKKSRAKKVKWVL